MSRDRTARTRIRQYLATSGPIVDPSGYATGVLKDVIGYTGSSVAFIQLIAAMDRDGEIEREIRGKRTYRIEGVGAAPAVSPEAIAPVAQVAGAVTASTQQGAELDYKLLAQALISELLAATASARAAAGTAEGSATLADQQAAERAEYLRRLEAARTQLDELLKDPMSALVDAARPAD